MSKYTIDEFIRQTKQDERGNEFFELETPRILEVNLKDLVWAKTGAMISYAGQYQVRTGKNARAWPREDVQKSLYRRRYIFNESDRKWPTLLG